MKKNTFLLLSILGLAVSGCSGPQEQSPPNVLILYADDRFSRPNPGIFR